MGSVAGNGRLWPLIAKCEALFTQLISELIIYTVYSVLADLPLFLLVGMSICATIGVYGV